MTVKKLKEILNNHHEDLHVFIRGYEGGYADVKNINNAKIKKNVNKEWWYGPHEINNKNYDKEGIILE